MASLKGKTVSWTSCNGRWKGKVKIDYGGYVFVQVADSSNKLWIPKDQITIET